MGQVLWIMLAIRRTYGKPCKTIVFSMFLVVQGVHVEAKLGYVEAMLRHLESMLGYLGPM